MLKFGFELEFFYQDEDNSIIPPPDLPTDGFPGLVEFRTTGGQTLEKSFAQLEEISLLHQEHLPNLLLIPERRYSGEEISKLRKLRYFNKTIVDVKNLYGKKPRYTRNHLASFQINISNQISTEYMAGDKLIPAQYGLLDIPNIIKNLDKEFEKEIKYSKRQSGFYAIKDNYRLEYRSLPNTVYSNPLQLYKRIKEILLPFSNREKIRI